MFRRKLLVSASVGVALLLAAVAFGSGSTAAPSATAGDPMALALADLETELSLLTQGEVTSASEGCGFCFALKDACASPSTRRCSPADPQCNCGFCNGRFDCRKLF